MSRIAILDYGMGNLRSVEKALERVGAEALITADHGAVRECDGVILPGVGAFGRAMELVRERRLDLLLRERVESGVAVLGICLGMQLLFESSSEGRGSEGVGLLAGAVERIPAPGLKVPNIGWREVSFERSSPLVDGLGESAAFYHVHSYAPRPSDRSVVLGTAEYGERFVSIVESGCVFGVQFHPEKSSAAGLALLRNFEAVCSGASVAA